MIDALKLCFLRGPAKLDAKQGELPTRLKLLNWGRNESTEGVVILDEHSASVFTANQALIGRARCQLDFEHNTVPGSEEYKRTTEPRNIAAFGAPKLIPGDGLYLENLDWKVAKEVARNFEDLSAAPILDQNRRVVALHSGALTKAGAVYDLPSFFEQAELKALAATLSNNNPLNQMNPELIITVPELAPVIGLSATASKTEVLSRFSILAALASIVTIKDGKVQTLAACALTDGKLPLPDLAGVDVRLKKVEEAGTKNIATLSATIDGKVVTFNAEDVVRLVTRVDKLETNVNETSTAAVTRERGELIARFSAEGKVPKGIDGKELTDAQLTTFAVDSIKLLLANTPATVPLTARGKKPAEKQGGELKGLAKAIAAHTAGE